MSIQRSQFSPTSAHIHTESKAALTFWLVGLGIITFDKVLTFKLSAFTIKSYYFLFLISAGITFFQLFREGRLLDALKKILQPPFIFILILFFYECIFAPFSLIPKKSFGYSVWLLFDLLVVMLSGALCLGNLAEEKRKDIVLFVLGLSGFVLSCIVILDHMAYFFNYHYRGGWIGYNQSLALTWNASRPHAFSYEPSYLAMNLAIILPLLFSLTLQTNAKKFGLAILSCISISIALYIMYSRSGWISCFLSFGLLGLLQARRILTPRNLTVLFGLIFAVVVAFLLSPKEQKDRMNEKTITTILEGKAESGFARLQAMKYGLVIGRDTHYLGTGVGASYFYYMKHYGDFRKEYETYSPPFPFNKIKFFIPPEMSQGAELIMSLWVQLFAESGIPGVILFFLFGFFLVKGLWAIECPDPFQAALLATCFIFFLFTAHWIGNIARTDIWGFMTIWYVFGIPNSKLS